MLHNMRHQLINYQTLNVVEILGREVVKFTRRRQEAHISALAEYVKNMGDITSTQEWQTWALTAISL